MFDNTIFDRRWDSEHVFSPPLILAHIYSNDTRRTCSIRCSMVDFCPAVTYIIYGWIRFGEKGFKKLNNYCPSPIISNALVHWRWSGDDRLRRFAPFAMCNAEVDLNFDRTFAFGCSVRRQGVWMRAILNDIVSMSTKQCAERGSSEKIWSSLCAKKSIVSPYANAFGFAPAVA